MGRTRDILAALAVTAACVAAIAFLLLVTIETAFFALVFQSARYLSVAAGAALLLAAAIYLLRRFALPLIDRMAWPRTLVIATAVCSLAAIVATESAYGFSRYRLGDAVYHVPHRYDFNGQVSWLFAANPALPKDSTHTVWLIFPAAELGHDLPAYRTRVHGYVGDYFDDLVVQVRADRSGRRFALDRTRLMQQVKEAEAAGAVRRIDPTTQWIRIMPKEANSKGHAVPGYNFNLLPPRLSANWMPLGCTSNEDQAGGEYISCYVQLHRNDRTFIALLPGENLTQADAIIRYVDARLERWRSW